MSVYDILSNRTRGEKETSESRAGCTACNGNMHSPYHRPLVIASGYDWHATC